jgi:hypothetical protein
MIAEVGLDPLPYELFSESVEAKDDHIRCMICMMMGAAKCPIKQRVCVCPALYKVQHIVSTDTTASTFLWTLLGAKEIGEQNGWSPTHKPRVVR